MPKESIENGGGTNETASEILQDKNCGDTRSAEHGSRTEEEAGSRQQASSTRGSQEVSGDQGSGEPVGSTHAPSSDVLVSDLRALVAKQAEPTKTWHKELLFGLFLRSDTKKLESLANETNARLSQCVKNRQRKREEATQKVSSIVSPPPKENMQSRTRSELTLVPVILRGFKKDSSSNVGQNRGPVPVPENWKRPDVSSRSLEDLEREVFSRFQSSSLGRNALLRPSSYHASDKAHRQAEVLESPSAHAKTAHQEIRGSTQAMLKNNDEDISNPSAEFAPFTLVYNECSLAAVSKWAKRGDIDDKRAKEEERLRTMDSTTFHRPAASPFFRFCSMCEKWGHYELECQELTSKNMVELSREINAQKTLRGFVEEKNAKCVDSPQKRSEEPVSNRGEELGNVSGENGDEAVDDDEYLTQSTACEVCGSGFNSENLLLCDGCDCLFHAQCLDPPLSSIPEGDWFCSKCEAYNSDVSSVVEIEGCDGFVIEQRKVTSRADSEYSTFLRSNAGVGFPDDGWTSAVGLVRRDKLPSFLCKRDRSTTSSAEETKKRESPKVRLTVGELCWAKRSNAPKGQAGRDEWWPSTVVNVTDRNPNKKNRGQELTPYVVKMYAAMGAGRVRASHVLPFFQHYEKLGYNRLLGRESKTGVDMSVFRKAVEEATYEMGCKSLLQALIKAREICGMEGAKGKKDQQGLTGQPEDDWLDAEETVEDGFVVRARRDPSAEETEVMHEENSSGTPATGSEDRGTRTSPDDPSSVQPRNVAGSIVAWHKTLERLSTKSCITANSLQMQYGVIIAVDFSKGKALVRPLPEMESILISNRTVTETRNLWRPPIRSCSVAASIWLNSDELQLICDPAPPDVRSKFSTDLDSRLKEEGERLKAQQEVKRPKDSQIKKLEFVKDATITSNTRSISNENSTGRATLPAAKYNERDGTENLKLAPFDQKGRKTAIPYEEKVRPRKVLGIAGKEKDGKVGRSQSLKASNNHKTSGEFNNDEDGDKNEQLTLDKQLGKTALAASKRLPEQLLSTLERREGSSGDGAIRISESAGATNPPKGINDDLLSGGSTVAATRFKARDTKPHAAKPTENQVATTFEGLPSKPGVEGVAKDTGRSDTLQTQMTTAANPTESQVVTTFEGTPSKPVVEGVAKDAGRSDTLQTQMTTVPLVRGTNVGTSSGESLHSRPAKQLRDSKMLATASSKESRQDSHDAQLESSSQLMKVTTPFVKAQNNDKISGENKRGANETAAKLPLTNKRKLNPGDIPGPVSAVRSPVEMGAKLPPPSERKHISVTSSAAKNVREQVKGSNRRTPLTSETRQGTTDDAAPLKSLSEEEQGHPNDTQVLGPRNGDGLDLAANIERNEHKAQVIEKATGDGTDFQKSYADVQASLHGGSDGTKNEGKAGSAVRAPKRKENIDDNSECADAITYSQVILTKSPSTSVWKQINADTGKLSAKVYAQNTSTIKQSTSRSEAADADSFKPEAIAQPSSAISAKASEQEKHETHRAEAVPTSGLRRETEAKLLSTSIPRKQRDDNKETLHGTAAWRMSNTDLSSATRPEERKRKSTGEEANATKPVIGTKTTVAEQKGKFKRLKKGAPSTLKRGAAFNILPPTTSNIRSATESVIGASLSSDTSPDTQPKGKFKRLKKGAPSKSKRRAAIENRPSTASNTGSSSESATRDADTELTQQLFGEDVYQAERILDERKVRSGGFQTTEYLIKWKGFSLKESTWEPERNILNRNFVRMYQAEKLAKALKETAEANENGSTTYRVACALDNGQKKLATGMPLARNRLCPFCLSRFRSASSYVGHMRKHKGETNFNLIEQAAKLAREDWFQN